METGGFLHLWEQTAQAIAKVPSFYLPLRLDKFLCNFTKLGRKDIKRLWIEGGHFQICTTNQLATPKTLSTLVFPEEDEVYFDGQKIDW